MAIPVEGSIARPLRLDLFQTVREASWNKFRVAMLKFTQTGPGVPSGNLDGVESGPALGRNFVSPPNWPIASSMTAAFKGILKNALGGTDSAQGNRGGLSGNIDYWFWDLSSLKQGRTREILISTGACPFNMSVGLQIYTDENLPIDQNAARASFSPISSVASPESNRVNAVSVSINETGAYSVEWHFSF